MPVIPEGTSLASASPTQSSRTRIQDVGRDPYFLTALQSASHANPVLREPNPVISSDLLGESSNGAGSNAKLEDAAAGCSPDTINDGGSVQVPPNVASAPMFRSQVAGGLNAPPLAGVVLSSPFLTAPSHLLPTTPGHSSLGNPAAGNAKHTIDHPGFRQSSTIFSDQHITLHETSSGIDILARNYFLDATQRKTMIQQLLNALTAAGKQPQRLTLNGEIVWQAGQSSETSVPAKLNEPRRHFSQQADRSN